MESVKMKVMPFESKVHGAIGLSVMNMCRKSGIAGACFLVFFAGAIPAFASSRMDRSKLQIGTYCLAPYARTEAHVKDLAACGIDFVYGVPATDRATLDLCGKYGVGVIATGAVPFWHGMGGEQAGQMRERRPLNTFEKGLAAYADHPAIWMLDYVDEPSALDFPYIGEVTRLMQMKMPQGVLPYINLYPNYAVGIQNSSSQTCNQLGTRTYREHVEAYVRDVPLDYLCFDFYLYSARGESRKSKLEEFYANFEDAASVCRQSGRSLWYIPQVNSSYGELWLSENMLRFQANLALAYGAEQIDWACWSVEDRKEDPDMPGLIGWWTNNVLTLTGERTQQYAKLKKVNAELHEIGPRYMKYRNVATRRMGGFVVGDMVARDGSGRRAMFVLAADDPFDEHPSRQIFSFFAASACAFGGTGRVSVRQNADGVRTVALNANAGVLIEYETISSDKRVL